MNAIEAALAKQRLQLACESQRDELSRHIAGLMPVFTALDQARSGSRWLGRHPEVLAAGVAFLLATSSGARRRAWRWGRRALVAWRLWRDGKRWLHER